jgi:S-DNA-T family DNA segregation ATPase FtsK/SpoIIIE
MGLKIVYLDKLLAVNIPEGLIECKLTPERQQAPEAGRAMPILAADSREEETSEEDKPVEVNYFQRSPRIIKVMDAEPLQIDPPPAPIKNQQQPAFLRMGPSMLMSRWEWVKHLPHVWAPGKSARYVATNSDEVKEVFQHLNGIIRQRDEAARESGGKSIPKLPHIVVLIADAKLVENQPVMRYLTSLGEDYGVSSILLFEQMGLLPKECCAFVQCNETECSLYHRDKPEAGMVEFKPDSLIGQDLMKYSRQMAAIKIKEDAATLSIPSSLSFLEMYRVGSVDQLDIKRRWRENHAYKSLEAPLGYMAGEVPFHLNIHEKFHGPHGLIAGMTGSGKSEFIISFLLSLAVNYHPYEVSFILIDYKGGGMANCFNGIAHVSGTITNLGGNQVYRSLVSIQSELKRRQSIFAQIWCKSH